MAPEKIRVVHLINQLGRGGTERQLYLLLCHHDAERFEHRVVVFNPSRHAAWDRDLAARGVEVRGFPEGCRGPLRRLAHLGRRLRSYRPHVLHSWTVHDNPYAGIAGRLLGVPVRWGSLRNTFHTPALQSLPSLYRHLMLHSVGRVMVNCRALAEELARDGYPAERILVQPNCVEIPGGGAKADLSRWGIVDGDPVVGVVANLRRRKNLLMFVRAMGRALPRHPRARAVIVGQPVDGEPGYPGEIEAEIERQGLRERLAVTGFVDDVAALMARLDVVCLSSSLEGMPNAVLEAMAAGRPVVATRVGGVEELLDDGVEGYVVASDASDAMAEAVGRLLTDPGLREKLGDAGRRRAVEEHGCRRAMERLENLYRNALEERRG